MFEREDFIIYGARGVCKVLDITTLELDEAVKDQLYYVLQPCRQPESRIFTPVEGNKTPMRSIISKEEADQLIDEIPSIDALWVDNDRMREAAYKECIQSCQCRDLIRVIKALYYRKQERMAQNKKVTAVDDKYFKLAEENLYAELAIPLEMQQDEVEEYIASRMER